VVYSMYHAARRLPVSLEEFVRTGRIHHQLHARDVDHLVSAAARGNALEKPVTNGKNALPKGVPEGTRPPAKR
jgi:hypothetical protein